MGVDTLGVRRRVYSKAYRINLISPLTPYSSLGVFLDVYEEKDIGRKDAVPDGKVLE